MKKSLKHKNEYQSSKNLQYFANAHLTIYKSLVQPHQDYSDMVYDQPNNQRFPKKIESVKYNAALAITNAIKRTSRTQFYKGLGIGSLSFRRWLRRLVLFIK